MKKLLFLACILFPLFTTAQHITGPRQVCTGGTVTLTDALPTSGGTWSASNTNVVFTSQGSASAQVTGVTQGTAIITYSTGDTFFVNVNTYISPVTGTPEFCISGTAQFSDATTGGVWSTSNTAIGTIGSTSGTVTGLKRGSLTITYTLTNACITGDLRTFNTLIDTPVNAIGYTSANICINSGTQFTNTTPRGTWGAALPSIASVSSGGYVTGQSQGTATISYTLYNTCGVTQATQIVTVQVPAGPIIGPRNIQLATNAQYSNVSSGGSWFLADSTNNSINTATGFLLTSGSVPNVALIYYLDTNTCGTTEDTASINLYYNALPGQTRVFDTSVYAELVALINGEQAVFIDNNNKPVFVDQVIDLMTGKGISAFIDQVSTRSAFIDQNTNRSAFVDSTGTAALVQIERENNNIINTLDSTNFKLDSANHLAYFSLRDLATIQIAILNIQKYVTYGAVTIVSVNATSTYTVPDNNIIIGGYNNTTAGAPVKLLATDITGENSTDFAFIIGSVPAQVPVQSFSGTTSHVVTAVNKVVLFVLSTN